MFEKLAGHSSCACKAWAEKISNVSRGDCIHQTFSCAKGCHILKSRMPVESFLAIPGDWLSIGYHKK